MAALASLIVGLSSSPGAMDLRINFFRGMIIDVNDAIETRACILKAPIVYLNDDPENLIREYLDVEDIQETVEKTILGICAIKKEGAEATDDLEDVGIIIKGVEVLHDLGDIANALAILFGLMYSLNLSYPTNL